MAHTNYQISTESTHIGSIGVGDTVEHNGRLMTVGRGNIKRGGFYGTTLFGDSYRAGNKPVQKVIFLGAIPACTVEVSA